MVPCLKIQSRTNLVTGRGVFTHSLVNKLTNAEFSFKFVDAPVLSLKV